MSKIILFLFLVIVFILISTRFVYSQVPTGTLLPGVNCGYAGSSGKESCCPLQTSGVSYQPQNVNNPIFNVINDTVSRVAKGFVDNAMTQVNQTFGSVAKPCYVGEPSTDVKSGQCLCVEVTPVAGALDSLKKFCDKQKTPNEQGSCYNCILGNNSDKTVGVWTGLGCAYTSNISAFLKNTVFVVGIGLAGIIALLCIIYSAFILQTSQGNPEKIKNAQERLTSCILGLLLIIFSVFILKLIGVDILRIPTFGK